ncbi:MAG TPA: sugar ABC transporter substrate-binding protein [Chloroflexota bacterium]|nr:sugar ABC transporter substrate-binding protein [Chloroflexota bacterium]
MKVHKSLRVSAALAVAAAVMAPISTAVPRPAHAASTVTLRFATWDTGNLLAFEKQLTSQFEKANPSIQVQVEAYGSGFDEKMAAAFGAGDPPDVEYMWNFPAYAPGLQPLDSLIAKDASVRSLVRQFYPAILNYNRFQGKLYALPIGFTTQVIFYNKTLFRAAHLAFPKNGWTWNDFARDARLLSHPGAKQFGCALPTQPDPYDWESLIWSNGGSWVSPNGKVLKGYLNSAQNAQALDMMGGLIHSKACTLAGGNNQLAPNDLFAAGKVALEYDGDWPLAQYQAAKIDFGVVGLPAFPGKPVRDVIDQSGIAISRASHNQAAAWKFALFYASAQGQAVRLGDLPVSPSVAVNRNGLNLLSSPTYKAFYDMVPSCVNTPASSLITNWGKVDSNIQNAISSVLLGQANAQSALNDAVSVSQRYMQ